MYIRKRQTGFTLLEMIVAVGVFSIIVLISTAALLAAINANRKLRTQQIVLQNLNFAVDSMVREMRTGTRYHCGGGDLDVPVSCTGSAQATEVAFERSGGDPADATDQVVYRLNGIALERSIDGGQNFSQVTSDNIHINAMLVRVYGAEADDNLQPRISVVFKGVAGSGKAETEFVIQVQATQRVLDS